MKSRLLLSLVFLAVVVSSAWAAPATMRLDYYHTGDADHEVFSMDRISIEPLPWPGDPAKAIDETNLGNYIFEVREKSSGRLLYSRGFSSIFAEWKTTDEAKEIKRTFSESLRFPAPTGPVKIVLKERKQGVFQEVWTASINPNDI